MYRSSYSINGQRLYAYIILSSFIWMSLEQSVSHFWIHASINLSIHSQHEEQNLCHLKIYHNLPKQKGCTHSQHISESSIDCQGCDLLVTQKYLDYQENQFSHHHPTFLIQNIRIKTLRSFDCKHDLSARGPPKEFI